MGGLKEKNVMVAMRDGVFLATDIYWPEGAGPHPTLVARTPYDKDGLSESVEIAAFAKAGYAVVIQDVRGRYASEGDFYPYVNETADALDLYDWLVGQQWCDGRIGTFGGSYLGGTQTLPARKGHPAIKAMAPEITFDDQFENCVYQGGAKVMHDLIWTVGSIIPEAARRAGVVAELPTAEEALWEIPVASHPGIRLWGAFYLDWLSRSAACDYWDAVSPRSGYDGMTMPALNISGWYDIFVHGTLNNYSEMRKRNKDARLVMGPWTHMNYTGRFPEISFGEGAGAASVGLTQIKIDWFDRHVKGMDDKPNGPPVKIFVMGVNEWRDEEDWPLPDTEYRTFCLGAGGRLSAEALDAPSAPGAETLEALDAPGAETLETLDAPGAPGAETRSVVGTSSDCADAVAAVAVRGCAGDFCGSTCGCDVAACNAVAYDSFAYDPMDPVPTIGGGVMLPGAGSGPKDQSPLNGRADILSYASDRLEEPLAVVGRVVVKLVASTDCLDADFTAKLIDVHPDGRDMLIADGILRARFRESFREPKSLTPGMAYKLEIDLGGTANVFLPGHRVRLDISGGNFPKYGRNSNTGGDISLEPADMYRVAHNRVYRCSRLILPIVDRKPPSQP